jgi:putative inorganic carbon (HCO3(-)) transporter
MLRTLFILLILIPGFAFAIRDRFAALLLYLWFAFFKPLDWLWMDLSGLRLSLVTGLMLVVPCLFTGILPHLTHPLSLGQLLFLAAALVAQMQAIDQAMGWQWIDFFARLTLVCLFAITLITTPQRLLWTLAVVSGSVGFYAAKAGVFSLLGGGVRFVDGLAGSFADNNGYALGTVMIMPLLLAVALNAPLLFDAKRAWMTPWVRRGIFLALPLCAITVVSTFSRGAFLAIAAAVLVFIALHPQRVRLSLGLAALLFVALSLVPIPDGYFDRLETIKTYEQINEESALSRFHFWQVAVRMANEQPFGIGLRNYEATYDAYDDSYGQYGHNRAVHSSHFQVLSELGYAGAIVWVLQFAIAFRIVFRLRRYSKTVGLTASTARFLESVAHCLSASMAAFLVGGNFVSLAVNDLTWVTFALLAALDRMAPALCGAASPQRTTPVLTQPLAPPRIDLAAARSLARPR